MPTSCLPAPLSAAAYGVTFAHKQWPIKSVGNSWPPGGMLGDGSMFSSQRPLYPIVVQKHTSRAGKLHASHAV